MYMELILTKGNHISVCTDTSAVKGFSESLLEEIKYSQG